MRGVRAFRAAARRRCNDVTEGFVGCRAPEAPGLPLPQIVPHAPVQRFSVHEPRLPHRARHDADVSEFVIGAFGPVSTAHGHGEADDFPAAFQPGFGKGGRDERRDQRIRGDDDVRARHQDRQQRTRPTHEELPDIGQLMGIQRREAGQRGTTVPVERRRNAPDTAFPCAQFPLLLPCIFVQTVWRVGDDRVHRVGRLPGQPRKAVVMVQFRPLKEEGCRSFFSSLPGLWNRKWPLARSVLSGAIHPARFSDKEVGSVEPEIRANRRRRRLAEPLANPRDDRSDTQRRR